MWNHFFWSFFRRGTSGGWGQSAALCTSFTPSMAPFQRFTGLDDFPRFPTFICQDNIIWIFPTKAIFDLKCFVQMVNKCWREQVEEGEQKSQQARIGNVFLIDRGETQPSLPSVGHKQTCILFSWMCRHRCGLCHSSVLTSGLWRPGRWHFPDQMWWVWKKLSCQLVPSTSDVCIFSLSYISQN